MSERMLRGLVAALGALVLLWAGISLASGDPRADDDGGELTRAFARVSGGSLSGATITSPDGESIDLVAGDTGWSVNGFRADSQVVQRVRDALDAARVTGLAGRNPANHGRFGLAGDSTWHVTLHSADDSVRLLIGGSGSGFSTAFVRLPERDDVYEVDGGLRSALARPLDDWRDRTIARVDTARIASLSLERDGAGMTVTRADSAWTLDGEAADSARVAQLLSALARVDASGFSDGTVDVSDDGVRRLVALDAAGDTLVALAFHRLDPDWYVRGKGDPQLYRISGYTVDRLVPAQDELAGR